MAGSVNKVILVGNLGRDPEVRSFQNGGKVVNLRSATSETWRDSNSGERKERTEWHSVVLQSDGLVGVAERYLRKGSKVYIEGQLRTRKWQDQSGNDRYTTEVALRWAGSETLPGYGKLSFAMYPGGRVIMVDARDTLEGIWRKQDNEYTLSFSNGSVVYTGTVNGATLSGTANAPGARQEAMRSWNWTVTQQPGS